MDIYSNHLIPFSLGIWARTHKFNPTAVQMTKDLQLIAKLDEESKLLERRKEAAEAALKATLLIAEQKLETTSNGY